MILLGFVELSFVWSGLTTRPDLNNVAWFLMGDLLRLSPWSGGPSRKRNFVIRVLLWVLLPCFWDRRKYCSRTLYSSLIIVKSLQLRGRKQIVEPHKYCLVCVIVFLWRVFSLFFISRRLGIRDNSLHFGRV